MQLGNAVQLLLCFQQPLQLLLLRSVLVLQLMWMLLLCIGPLQQRLWHLSLLLPTVLFFCCSSCWCCC
jgi:hypothetical protein